MTIDNNPHRLHRARAIPGTHQHLRTVQRGNQRNRELLTLRHRHHQRHVHFEHTTLLYAQVPLRHHSVLGYRGKRIHTPVAGKHHQPLVVLRACRVRTGIQRQPTQVGEDVVHLLVLAGALFDPSGLEEHRVSLELVAATLALPAEGVPLRHPLEVEGVLVRLVAQPLGGLAVAREVAQGLYLRDVDKVAAVALHVAVAPTEILDVLHMEVVVAVVALLQPPIAVQRILHILQEPVEPHRTPCRVLPTGVHHVALLAEQPRELLTLRHGVHRRIEELRIMLILAEVYLATADLRQQEAQHRPKRPAARPTPCTHQRPVSQTVLHTRRYLVP